jgi:TMEM199 family protein
MAKTTIEDPTVRLRPSQRLVDYIYQLDEHSMPENVRAIYMAKHKSKKRPALFDDIIPSVQFTQSEVKILKDLNEEGQDPVEEPVGEEKDEKRVDLGQDFVLERNDLKWLHQVLATKRKESKSGELKVYLHELLADCQLVLPENQILQRNPVLEERCKKLRLQQSNREYHEMTKNVDNVRRNLPEDTLAFQSKQKSDKFEYYQNVKPL